MNKEITKELFQRYTETPEGEKKRALTKALGFECDPDMDESFYIWAVNHGEKNLVMSFYQMSEQEYLKARELWADEGVAA